MENKKQPGMSKHVIIIGCLLATILILVVVLLAIPYLAGKKRFTSKEHGYSLVVDTRNADYKSVLLDTVSKVRMDRFDIKRTNGAYYMSVAPIAEGSDLEEDIALVMKSETYSYEFRREDNVTYGEGRYPAVKISYTDSDGGETREVDYYYDKENRLIITVCTNEANRAELESMLASIRILEK